MHLYLDVFISQVLFEHANLDCSSATGPPRKNSGTKRWVNIVQLWLKVGLGEGNARACICGHGTQGLMPKERCGHEDLKSGILGAD